MKENRYRDGYRDGLQNIYVNVRTAERMLVTDADADEDEKHAAVMRTLARAYGVVAEWVADEIRAADAEVRNGGEDND